MDDASSGGTRERILKTLKLAQDLGAKTAILAGATLISRRRSAPAPVSATRLAVLPFAENNNVRSLAISTAEQIEVLRLLVPVPVKASAIVPPIPTH